MNYWLKTGLSPRVRGNPARRPRSLRASRSIPARAGEPSRRPLGITSIPVYPRACGGTSSTRSSSTMPGGLSPRVRGNRYRPPHTHRSRWSIPARAGEPHNTGSGVSSRRVYPRACGGTQRRLVVDEGEGGLSPRVRGNRRGERSRPARKGSIPARAGEPYRTMIELVVSKVYPRACGGTGKLEARLQLLDGLSPRVRGNLPALCQWEEGNRSIPARAGEPHHHAE